MTCLEGVLPRSITVYCTVGTGAFVATRLRGSISHFRVYSPNRTRVYSLLSVPSGVVIVSNICGAPRIVRGVITGKGYSEVFAMRSLARFGLFERLSRGCGGGVSLLLELAGKDRFKVGSSRVRRVVSGEGRFRCLSVLNVRFFSKARGASLGGLGERVSGLSGLLVLLGRGCSCATRRLRCNAKFPTTCFGRSAVGRSRLVNKFTRLLGRVASGPGVALRLKQDVTTVYNGCCARVISGGYGGKRGCLLISNKVGRVICCNRRVTVGRPCLSIYKGRARPYARS